MEGTVSVNETQVQLTMEDELLVAEALLKIETSWNKKEQWSGEQLINGVLSDHRFARLREQSPETELAKHLEKIQLRFDELKLRCERMEKMEDLWLELVGVEDDKPCLIDNAVESCDFAALQAALEACTLPCHQKEEIELLAIISDRWPLETSDRAQVLLRSLLHQFWEPREKRLLEAEEMYRASKAEYERYS